MRLRSLQACMCTHQRGAVLNTTDHAARPFCPHDSVKQNSIANGPGAGFGPILMHDPTGLLEALVALPEAARTGVEPSTTLVLSFARRGTVVRPWHERFLSLVARAHVRRWRTPLAIQTPRSCCWGQEIFTTVNPYGKHVLGPDNILGGPNRERRWRKLRLLSKSDMAAGVVPHASAFPTTAPSAKPPTNPPKKPPTKPTQPSEIVDPLGSDRGVLQPRDMASALNAH